MTEQDAKTLAAELDSNRYWSVKDVYRSYSGEYGIQLALREDPTIITILVGTRDARLLSELGQRRKWLIDLYARSRDNCI